MLRLFCYFLSTAVLIATWQAFGHSFGILFVPFTATVARLWSMLTDGPLLEALGVSAELYLATVAISIVVGVALGLALARFPLVADALEPWIFVLYATPTIALVPFISVTLGFGLWPKVLVAVLISIFPILFGVMQGARSMPPLHLDVAAMFGSNERQLWRDVILPYVAPFAMSGIKQSIALAMAGTLVAEFFLNPDGVAAVLLQATTVVNSASVLAVTLFVAILAVLLVGVGELIERRLIRWRESATG
ncbi:MAG: ABC transporter permease subunit [Pseudomonadota bacterium]|nr:ABC transporter permease subunit [Pseudomonadota bacterium]